MNLSKTKLKVMTKQDGTVNIGQESAEKWKNFSTWLVSLVKPHAKISRHASVKQDIHSPS